MLPVEICVNVTAGFCRDALPDRSRQCHGGAGGWEDAPKSRACTIYLPAAIWLSLGYFAVVRFLSYLDLRIRTEGWEVELIMRAEGARLTRQLA